MHRNLQNETKSERTENNDDVDDECVSSSSDGIAHEHRTVHK